MTADRLFTPPATDESAGQARQARDFLALAMTPEDLSRWRGTSGQLDYEHGFQAVRDALIGNAHATLAVNANLDRIATALEMLAKTPAALERLGDQVAAAGQVVQDRLTDLGNELFDLRSDLEKTTDSTNCAIRSVVVGLHELTDSVAQLAEPRPPWWRRWFRRPAVEQTAQTDIEA